MQTLEAELRELVQRFNEENVSYALCGGMICVVSAEGLVEMKRAAGRDVDLLDIKNLGFDQHEQ